MTLTSTNLENPSPSPDPVTDDSAEMPVWLQRVFVVVYVLFCIELGLVLITLPWAGSGLVTGYWHSGPALQRFMQLGFVRGAVSRLGLLGIWLGIVEAVRYRDRR